jgi:mannose-6-phosphate isomerase-like protein (cupin superfamily)
MKNNNINNVITIKSYDHLIAIIVKNEFSINGLHFFSPELLPQQLGYMSYPSGHIISPHVHKKVKRIIYETTEVLFIKSGRVKVDFYTDNKLLIETFIVSKGDTVLLVSGGHGFEMLEPSEIIEVKQGPYLGDQDKSKFYLDEDTL